MFVAAWWEQRDLMAWQSGGWAQEAERSTHRKEADWCGVEGVACGRVAGGWWEGEADARGRT